MLLEASGEGKWLHVSSFTWRLFLFSVCNAETSDKGRNYLITFAKTDLD